MRGGKIYRSGGEFVLTRIDFNPVSFGNRAISIELQLTVEAVSCHCLVATLATDGRHPSYVPIGNRRL